MLLLLLLLRAISHENMYYEYRVEKEKNFFFHFTYAARLEVLGAGSNSSFCG